MSTILELGNQIATWAETKGWSNPDRPFSEWIALLHTEISEAYEEYRDNHEPNEIYYSTNFSKYRNTPKPEGVPIELADLAIRLLHMCHAYGIDLEDAIETKMAFNEKRSYRHGGKRQ